jgi:hypothetical protein
MSVPQLVQAVKACGATLEELVTGGFYQIDIDTIVQLVVSSCVVAVVVVVVVVVVVLTVACSLPALRRLWVGDSPRRTNMGCVSLSLCLCLCLPGTVTVTVTVFMVVSHGGAVSMAGFSYSYSLDKLERLARDAPAMRMVAASGMPSPHPLSVSVCVSFSLAFVVGSFADHHHQFEIRRVKSNESAIWSCEWATRRSSSLMNGEHDTLMVLKTLIVERYRDRQTERDIGMMTNACRRRHRTSFADR